MFTIFAGLNLKIAAMTGKKYKIGLVGVGRMGERWAKIISDSPMAELSLVVDPNKEVGEKIAKLYGATYLKEFPPKNLDVDAFFIVTPHAYLYQNARHALRFNKPVFIEKPGARNAAELKKLIALAKKKRQPLMIGFNYRFFEAIIKSKKVIDAKTLGEILFVRLRHGHQGRIGYEKEWRMDKKIAGGGVLMDQGVHLVDLILWFMPGNIKKLSAVSQNLFYKSNVEEQASIIFKNVKGQTASMSVGITEWRPIFSLEIIGEKGYARVEGLGRKYGGKEILTIGVKDKDDNFAEETTECNPEPGNALEALFGEFIKAIETGKMSGPTGEEALQVLQIVEKTYKILDKK